jgi:hypothetical protein
LERRKWIVENYGNRNWRGGNGLDWRRRPREEEPERRKWIREKNE